MTPALPGEEVDVLDQIAEARALLVFDYDGALAEYVDDRVAAGMRLETRKLLHTTALLYPCAVASGRARADLAARLEGMPLVGIIGNHGAESEREFRDPAMQARVVEWQALLERALVDEEGIEIENKGLSIAIHHRRARSWSDARRRIRAAILQLENAITFEGYAVVNVLPKGASTKANAIRRICERCGLNVVVWVGNDRSGEESFRCDAVTVAIRIGIEAASRARFALPGQADIDELLRALIIGRARLDGQEGDCDAIARALGGVRRWT